MTDTTPSVSVAVDDAAVASASSVRADPGALFTSKYSFYPHHEMGSNEGERQGVYYVAGSRTAGFWETAHFHLAPPRVSWSTAVGPLGPPGYPWGPSVRIATYELGVCDV
jgi:hypothetical protein